MGTSVVCSHFARFIMKLFCDCKFQRLEEEFAKQRDEQEKFYGAVVMTGESTYVPRSAPSSTRHKGDESLKSRHSTVI